MELPDRMLLLEPLHCTAEEILQQGARNPAAVHRYLDCLSRGWLGQALIERYTYGEAPSTPAGMLQTNEIRNGRRVDWFKPISDEIKDDLRELLSGGYAEELVVERDVYAKAVEYHLDDPRREFLGELVDMIDHGLQDMPKICVTVKNGQGVEVAPSIELQWVSGLEGAITQLSQEVLDEAIVGMDIKKSGGNFQITYQVDDAEDHSSALALVEEMKEWR